MVRLHLDLEGPNGVRVVGRVTDAQAASVEPVVHRAMALIRADWARLVGRPVLRHRAMHEVVGAAERLRVAVEAAGHDVLVTAGGSVPADMT